MGKSLKVVSEGERWSVTEEGAEAPLARCRTQDEAWERAKSLARKYRSEAVLYGRDGTIRARSDYGFKG